MALTDDFEQQDSTNTPASKPQASLIDEFEQQDQQQPSSPVSPQERQRRMIRAQSPLPAQDIRPMEAFAHGLMMPFGHVPPGDVYNQHPKMADAGAIASMVGQSLPIGGPFTATTRAAKAGLGALGGLGYAAVPEYLKGVLQGKTHGQSLKDAALSGIFGAGLGAVLPGAVELGGKVINHFKTLAYNTPVITHLINKAFDKFQAETNVATLSAKKAWDTVSSGLTKDSLSRVFDHLEKPGSVPNLTEAETNVANKYTELLKPVQDMIKKEGLSEVFHDNYVKHIYENKTDEIYDYIKNMPGSKERKFDTIQDAIKFNKDKIEEVKQRGFDPEVVKKMTLDELTANGFDKRMPRWLGLKAIQDPGLALAATIKSAYQTLNVKNYIHELSEIKDEAGNHLLETAGQGNKNYKTIDDPRGLLKKYFFAGGTGRTTYLREGNVGVLKQYAPMVESILNSNSPNQIQSGLKEANRVLKSLTFYNPAWHMVNLFTEGLKVMPGNIGRAMGLGADQVLKSEDMLHRMVASGVSSEMVMEAKNSMYQAFKQVSQANKIPILSELSNTLNKFQHKTLWTYASNLQSNIWSSYRSNFLKKGFSPEVAEKMAAEITNDSMGLVAKNRIPELLKDPVFGKWVAFIPQWITTKSRQLLGTVAPGMVFKSFNKEQQTALQKQYILHTMYGASQWMASAALLNKALSGHWPWENSPGNKTPEKIETHFGVTIDNPFFKGLTMPYRLAKSLHDVSPRFVSPPLKAAIGQMTGKDTLTGKPFIGNGMTKEDQLKARGMQVLKEMNLFGTGSLIRESEKVQPQYGQAAAQMLLPVYITKDNPAGPVITKLFNMRKVDSPFHDIQFTPPWEKDIDRALLKNDYATATSIAKDHGKSLDYLRKQQMKFKYPISYALQYSFKGKDRDKYINMLSNEERAKLFGALKQEQEKQAEQ